MVGGEFSGKGERRLFRLPIVLAVAFGLVFMVGRFIAVLRADFKEAPDNWVGAHCRKNCNEGNRSTDYGVCAPWPVPESTSMNASTLRAGVQAAPHRRAPTRGRDR